MAYVIAEPCIGVKDSACVDACPVDCIHPKKNTTYEDGRPGFEEVPQLYIDPVECIDCGACVPVCPVSAIFALDDLPEKWKHYAELNSSYVEGGKFKNEEYAKHQAAKYRDACSSHPPKAGDRNRKRHSANRQKAGARVGITGGRNEPNLKAPAARTAKS